MVTVAAEMKKRGMTTPLLIGGATTSKRHTAVKISPKYDRSIYVKDASLSVGVVQGLLGEDVQDFLDDINENYDDVREEYYAGMLEKKYFPLKKTREMALKLDFTPGKNVFTPKCIGNTCFKHHDIGELVKYIDWTEFFNVYQLVGTYPTRDFPKIFKDGTVGSTCKELYDEAQEMLKIVLEKKSIQCSAVCGVWPANSVGDDIEVYTDETRTEVKTIFYGLRQQMQMGQKECLCQSDFVAPKDSGVKDYIGALACTGGINVEPIKKVYEEAGEIDKSILLDALADRLAEAFTERVHEKMRKEIWGCVPDEKLTVEEMLKVKYQGIRPAQGYPTQPDHREKTQLWKLLDIDELSSGEMVLTDSFMMMPAASVSALVFSHPEARYFSVGALDKDQAVNYAERRKETLEENERWLGSSVLGYL